MSNLIDKIPTPLITIDGTEQVYAVKNLSTDVRFPVQLIADLITINTARIEDDAVTDAKVSAAIRLSLGKADSAQQPPSEGAFVNGDKTKLDTYSEANQTTNNAKVTYPSADATKVGHITVTQAVNLDTMESDIAALVNGMVYKGDWDASAGTFPGSGSAQIGWFYNVSVAGTVDSIAFAVGDSIIAKVDDASTSTYAANWVKKDQTDAVQSVVGLLGTITKSALLAALNVVDGATANSTNATLLARANHTGTQLAATISDFVATVRATVLTGLSTATSTAVVAADTILVAIGKLQAQVSLKVTGPASAVNNNFAAFDTTTGKLIKDSSSKASDFATAAQGTTADNALPKAGGTMTGNIALNGNYLSGDGGDEGVFVAANGNVGIGANNPGGKLDIRTSGIGLKLTDSGGNAYIENSDTWGLKWKFARESANAEMNQANTAWQFNINQTGGGLTKFRFNNNKTTSGGVAGAIMDLNIDRSAAFYGNVGIGTTAPDTKLQVAGAITQQPLSSDPADPDAGNSVQWVSSGVGSGDAGDIMLKVNVGGTTKIITLIDYSIA